jgi:hypothetical protein
MQQHVILFLCHAEFSGRSEVPYAQAPVVGSEYECILFVAQPKPAPDYEVARSRLSKHGWANVHIKSAGPFQSESVNAQQWQAFQHHYEECLVHGDSVVWYA